MRRILKYGTDQAVPANSKYLATVAQTERLVPGHKLIVMSGPDKGQEWTTPAEWKKCWLVWHYYEVEQ